MMAFAMGSLNLPSAKTPAHKTCESCGAGFSCAAPAGPCWCESLELSAAVLADLRVKFRDCLCPRCLDAAKASTRS